MSEEVKVKMSIPMFEVGELERFDNNIHNIIEEYSKMMLKEKDQILTQRIIIKQEQEIKDLQQENKQLKEDLRVSQSNEETYCLEMQEITKILGLDEHTLFDDVKYYAKQLKEEIKKYINSNDFVYDELYKKREKIEKILGDKS